MARNRTYDELLEDLKGHSVLIWTCKTCIRLCGNIGGLESSERLSNRLKADGINVTGIASTSAGCLENKVIGKIDFELLAHSDIILVLACDIGSECVKNIFKKDVINPICTLGCGYMDSDENLFLCVDDNGKKSYKLLSDFLKNSDLSVGPFV